MVASQGSGFASWGRPLLLGVCNLRLLSERVIEHSPVTRPLRTALWGKRGPLLPEARRPAAEGQLPSACWVSRLPGSVDTASQITISPHGSTAPREGKANLWRMSQTERLRACRPVSSSGPVLESARPTVGLVASEDGEKRAPCCKGYGQRADICKPGRGPAGDLSRPVEGLLLQQAVWTKT